MAQYYKFTPCSGSTGTEFYSAVDVGVNFVGDVVNFPNIQPDSCFVVSVIESEIAPTPFVVIIWEEQIVNLYTTCEQCANRILNQCFCTVITNVSDSPRQFRYIDCSGFIQNYPAVGHLNPGETSPKICVSLWAEIFGGEVKYFGNCTNEECPTTAFELYSCDGSVAPFCTDNQDLIDYIGDFVSIDEIPTTCFYVKEVPLEYCLTPTIVTVSIVQNCTGCDLNCYEVDKGEITYVDENNVLSGLIGPAKFCSKIYPVVDSGELKYTITESGPCVDGECPLKCYVLTDCSDPGNFITSTSSVLDEHYNANHIVIIQGYDTCWTIGEAIDCNCAIDVTVLRYYETCEDCLGTTSYKLTNCDDGTIRYTLDDLSDYVGKVVEINDCPGCWIVEELDYLPPSVGTVTVNFSFEDCVSCAQTYWRLEDCNNVEKDIITVTDLSFYEGEVIRLTWCPNICWTVTSTRDAENATVVFVENNYVDCQTCLLDVLPCLCSYVTNNRQVEKTYTYINCDNERNTVRVIPGMKSPKVCAKQWTNLTETDVLTSLGNCVDNQCPTIDVPRYTVKPGYNTPYCSAEKYEQITCRAAEILYKRVLEKRYGISNCCPDLDSDWLLKKELIDLDALRNPDYECSATTTCCQQPVSNCNCSCNS